MTTESIETAQTSVLESLRGTRDALSVRRAFGDPYVIDGVTVIPAARVTGGGGGGGGEGSEGEGGGFGSGFGLATQPIGVYEIRDGKVDWKPLIDVNRLIKGSQVLAGIFAVCITLVLLRRSR